MKRTAIAILASVGLALSLTACPNSSVTALNAAQRNLWSVPQTDNWVGTKSGFSGHPTHLLFPDGRLLTHLAFDTSSPINFVPKTSSSIESGALAYTSPGGDYIKGNCKYE
jgi:hypothetical protein